VTRGSFVRPEADRDLDDIADDSSEQDTLDVGLKFLAGFYKTLALLSTNPEMGWPCRLPNHQLTGVRVFQVSKPFEKYLIFYQSFGNQIEILRVLHGAQDIEQILSTEGAF
jgi:toxin ParE1/3/4